MKVNLKTAVKNYKVKNIVDCVQEAIVNSIQANAKNITVILSSKYPNDDINKSITSLDKITITDDGEGFSKENQNSFLTMYSAHKEKLGCKGIGRLSYLKMFNNVHISSVYSNQDNNIKEKVDFTFKIDGIYNEKLKKVSDTIQSTKIETGIKETIITLYGIKATKEETINIDEFYKQIYDHIFPFLLFSEKDIIIQIQDKIITGKDIKDIKQKEFSVESHDNKNINFKLYYHFQKSLKAELYASICCNSRAVQKFQEPPLGLELQSYPKYKTLFLLTSDWLNEQLNQYHELELPKNDEIEEQEYLFENKNIWKLIKIELVKHLNSIIETQFPNIKKENQEVVQNLKKDYLCYANYISSENEIVGFVKREKLLENARKKASKQEDQLVDGTLEKDKVKECVGNALIRYVQCRQRIIDNLAELLENPNTLEKEIHNLFIKKGNEGTDIIPMPLEDNNIWLLDDKFMSYSYIASEKTIHKFLKDKGFESQKNDDRMDIIIYFDSNNKRRAVVIELKKPDLNYKENGTGRAQLFNYSKKLFDAGVKELYLYLLCEIDEAFRDELENSLNFKKIFSHAGEIWQHSYLDRGAYIQIIHPKSIIADAKARNQTFIDILEKSILSNNNKEESNS